MEKIDVLLWARDGGPDVATVRDRLTALAPDDLGVAELAVFTADTAEAIPRPPLQIGRGGELAGVVSAWVDSVDDRHPLLDAVAAAGEVRPGDGLDAYLVTESVPLERTVPAAPVGTRSPGVIHFTCFPRPERLTPEEFFHGWHDVHSPASFRLHPGRTGYVRDSVARCLTLGSPPYAAIVFEHFPTVDDYTDPAKLYGPPETMDETMANLPGYADFESLDGRPLFETVLRRR